MNHTWNAKMLDQTVEESQSRRQHSHIFILVNSRSGSWHGTQLIQKYKNPVNIDNANNFTSTVYVHDLYLAQSKNKGFEKMQKLCQQGENVHIVIAGGDGTVQWVLSQCLERKVNFEKVFFATLPIGTGNDFANSIGWNRFKFDSSLKFLRLLARKLNSANPIGYDIWDCEVQCYPTGSITEIKNGQETKIQGLKISKSFTNYFGIGADARVSYLAQKINASTVCLKKLAYGAAGFWSYFKCAAKVGRNLLNFLQYGQTTQNYTEQNQLSSKAIEVQNSSGAEKQSLLLSQNDGCISFLNSTSSMEIEGIWQSPYSINKDRIFKSQKVDDGLIEVVTYSNEFSLAFERGVHMATKICQGEGPFYLQFREPHPSKSQQTYIHVNGEPYKVTSIRSITVRKNSQIPDSKIKVLVPVL